MDPVLEQLHAEIASAVGDLNIAQTQLRSRNSTKPDRWTIQQILEHLFLTYSSTEDAISARLAKGTPTRTRPTLPQHCMQFFVTKFGYMPSGREAPLPVIPPAATPAESCLNGAALAAKAREHLNRLDCILDTAEQRFGSVAAVTHFVLGPLTPSQWRCFHRTHGRHHLRQIAAIRRDHNL